MLLSIAIIIVVGMFLGWICKLIHFPSLFGMIVAGIIIGPAVLNWIDPTILNISSEIRRIALIIILLRAGLKLSLADLKKVGRPAILMCFVPACLEMLGMVLLAPMLLGISVIDAALLGAVIAAVSPAVIVPKMIKLMDEGYGTKEGIPQMILAGASVDDVFVIVIFTTFMSIEQGNGFSVMSLVNIPLSIIIGIAVGILLGFILVWFWKRCKMRNTVKVAVLLCASFGLVTFEDKFSYIIPFAALLCVMCLGIEIKREDDALAVALSSKFDKLWVVAEVFLFVLVGASVAIERALSAGLMVIVLTLAVLVFRMVGVFLCTLGTSFSWKERVFAMLAYTPKATVQAAIGGLPLAAGLACGDTILTASVIAIMLTAPLGAFAIDLTYKRLLKKN